MVANHDRDRWIWAVAAVVGLAISIMTRPAPCQEAPAATPAGQPSPEQMKAIEAARAAGQPGGPPGAQPATPPGAEAPKEGEKKEGEAEKKDAPADSVKRPEKPPRVPDPREFEVALDKNGRVPAFNFIGQPWPDVMQWLATISKTSLDWQELPNDYVNLTTPRSYTVDEVRDLVNRHLHARGYTAVQSGDVLSVFKIDKLDPSVVRRVTEDELYDLKPYDFVKVSFELPASMEIEKAKEDVKQVLSPNAKVFPLVTTKRLLVMDSVANLRLVSGLLNEERSVQSGRIVPREFVLKHARPERVIDILYVVLGMDPQSRPTQMELQVQQQKLQLMTQMQQQGKDVASMLQKDGPPVYLAYNKQRNSVLANAPPEQMKIIEQTIRYLDVPFGDAETGDAASSVAGVSDAGQNGAAGGGNGQRVMKKYPLVTLDPETFVMTLEEIGGLSPAAEFKVDKKSKTLFALAVETDHQKINALIDQFDGSGRDFHVLWLRRLPADAVAASIYNLMAGQAEEEDDNRNRYPWYWDYDSRNEEEDKPVKGFGVDADIENNRLLLWANEAEMERVRGLLVKLGEIPEGQQDLRRIRFIQPAGGAPSTELLERIREAWSASGNNELIIKVPPKAEAKATDPKKTEKQEDEKADESAQKVKDRTAAMQVSGQVRAQFVQLDSAESDPLESALQDNDAEDTSTAEEPSEPPSSDAAALAKPAPVTITLTDDGRLMISSSDPVALDRMEELIAELTPSEKRFKVFHLKHTTALNMWYTLDDFFKEELKGETEDSYDFFWYPPRRRTEEKSGGTGLSKRRKLIISWDTPSNTILVANASPSQLREIEELIEVYDKPAPADSVRARRMALIKIKYSKASVIAAALKEVYVDLLSSKDKEFDRGGDQRRGGSSTERTTIIRYGNESGSGNQRPSPVKVGFEGALSVGVDDISNTILVSVQEELYESVVAMVEQLDKEAQSDTVVRVHRVNGNVTAEALRETINDALSKPWLGGRPDPQAGGDRGGRRGDQDRGPGRDRGRRDRDRDRDRDNREGDGDRDRDNDNDND
jgi:type II secretory pathway component GspD/PulD (secretin)